MTTAAGVDEAGGPLVVVIHELDPSWQWISHHLADTVRWRFVRLSREGNRVSRRLRGFFTALKAVRAARDADLIVSTGPGAAAAVELARKFTDTRTRHVVLAFNYASLPTGLARARGRWLLRGVDRFMVSASMEGPLYARHFGLDPARFDLVLWGVRSPEAGERVVETRDYVCAIGGNGRDYRLLMQVAAARPDIPFVVVARPANLDGLTVPPNVSVLTNIPLADAMAVLRDARMMVLPLVDARTPCGHVTIVAAFYLGTPLIITASTGVADYVRHEETGLLVGSGSADDMTAAIDRLRNDPATAERLADTARDFAVTRCTERNYVDYVRAILNL